MNAPRVLATGAGPWPGTDPLEALRTVVGELDGEGGMPFLPHLPARGPGADAVGRTAALLVDVPVDLQPAGWRLTDRPGRDAGRAAGYLRSDLDALAEACDGYAGPLAVRCLGPWTLAGSLWLPRGERAAVDAGASGDLVASLAEGVANHVADVKRLVSGARVAVVLDEPDLLAVLGGRVRRASGWGRLPPVGLHVVREGLATVVDAVHGAGASVAVAVPLAREADDGPAPGASALLAELRTASTDGVGLDLAAVAALGAEGWEALAHAQEAASRLWLTPSPGSPSEVVEAITAPWRRLGMDVAGLGDVVLAARAPRDGSAAAARDALATLRRAADALTDAVGAA